MLSCTSSHKQTKEFKDKVKVILTKTGAAGLIYFFYRILGNCPVTQPLRKFSSRNRVTPVSIQDGVEHGITFAAISMISVAPSDIVFQEQSYSSLHSGRSLAWDHFRGDIDDPCSVIANFCVVITDPWCNRLSPMRRFRSLHDSLNMVNHSKTLWYIVKCWEPLLKHCETSRNTRTLTIPCDDLGAETSALSAAILALVQSFWQYRRLLSWYNSADV